MTALAIAIAGWIAAVLAVAVGLIGAEAFLHEAFARRLAREHGTPGADFHVTLCGGSVSMTVKTPAEEGGE